jgi:hypothetical protein
MNLSKARMYSDISKYKKNSRFYKPKSLLLTVKSFELEKIRKRYLESRKNKSGRVGSVERRDAAKGGLVLVDIEDGYISGHEVISFLTEPRGIDVCSDVVAVSSENAIHIIRRDGTERIDNPWFSYIHTLCFNRRHEPDRLLVSSSGFDCLFEYELENYTKTWEWFAWEHGFQQGLDPLTGKELYLTRNVLEASEFRKAGKEYLLISDPEKKTLPTAQRAAFINSVVYDQLKPGKLLATFFHDGAVYRIDMQSGKSEMIIGGMSSPHGGRNYRDGYMATDTAGGRICFSKSNGISFRNLPGKPKGLSELEWLQNSVPLNDCIITIDANRNSFVIIDPARRLYDMVTYDPNWAIQDMAEAGSMETRELVKSIRDSL